MDGNSVIQGRGIVHTGARLNRAADHALNLALREAEVEEFDLTIIIATGFGRFAVPFSHWHATEPECNARGAIYRYPETRTVLDMGGQDMTAIRIDEEGNVLDFAMNDKCAAGGGRFLESLGDLLGMTIDQIRTFRDDPDEELPITNVCSVFAEQEIIDYLERGKPVGDILSGTFCSIAARGASLLRRVGLNPEITISGGIGHIGGVIGALEDIVGMKVNSGIDSVYIGAAGAALVGIDRVEKRNNHG